MKNDDDVAFVYESEIQKFVQRFLNMSNLGKEVGEVYLPPEMWKEEIETFKKKFKREWNGEYIVDAHTLFNYLNDIILHLVERVCNEGVKDGSMEVLWNSEINDFVFRKVK